MFLSCVRSTGAVVACLFLAVAPVAGATWNELGPTVALGPGWTPGVAVTSDGVVHVVYFSTARTPFTVGTMLYRTYTPAGGLGDEVRALTMTSETDMNSPHLVADDNDVLHVVYGHKSLGSATKAWYSNNSGGTWKESVVVLDNPDKRINYPRLFVDGTRAYVGAFTGSGILCRVENILTAPTVATTSNTNLWLPHPLVSSTGALFVVGRNGPSGHYLYTYTQNFAKQSELKLSNGTPQKTGEPCNAIVDESDVVHAVGVCEVVWYNNSQRAGAGQDVILGQDFGTWVGELVWPVMVKDAQGRLYVAYSRGGGQVCTIDGSAFSDRTQFASSITVRHRYNCQIDAARGGGVYIAWDNDGVCYLRSVGVDISVAVSHPASAAARRVHGAAQPQVQYDLRGRVAARSQAGGTALVPAANLLISPH